MSKESRTKISNVLKKKGFPDLEKEIYNMCLKISKNEGISVQEIYADLAYEKVGQILTVPKEEIPKIISDMKKSKEGWDSFIFENERIEYEKQMNRQIQKPTAVKGLYKCKEKGCDSDLFYTWSLQTRSGDEGTTNYRQCAKCGARGKQ